MKILITGGTNGMGKGVAKALAAYGSEENEIIILCRSETLGLSTIDEIKKENPGATLSLALCDLMDMGSVRSAALTIKSRHDFLDAVFINAGLGYASQRIETPEGMDSHFQVNYLSQFYLVTLLLGLLEKSTRGGRVIFNATPGGKIYWDDMQLSIQWSYENAIHQAMAAKRMLLITLHDLYKEKANKISFIGFAIHQTVWSNQINIIPASMRIVATIMKAFGLFISIEKCGEIMAPLFMEGSKETSHKSGSLLTWKDNSFQVLKEDANVMDESQRKKLLDYSVGLCKDEAIRAIFDQALRKENL
jgi:NAD(P)-dependent dehydrogenase (short-subunit alcohol dehydrogenase family)